MEIKVDINKLIEDIAVKLGVAVEKVYPMLYKQAIIDGSFSLLTVGLCGLGLYGGIKLFKKAGKEIKENTFRDWTDYPGLILPAFALFIISSVIGAMSLKDGANALLNTDWYIINSLLDKIKS